MVSVDGLMSGSTCVVVEVPSLYTIPLQVPQVLFPIMFPPIHNYHELQCADSELALRETGLINIVLVLDFDNLHVKTLKYHSFVLYDTCQYNSTFHHWRQS